MENTLENKAKFFAQYWGQKVLYVGGIGLAPIGTNGWNLKHPDFFLELTPLSDITDEDAIEFFDIVWSKVGTHKNKSREFKIDFGKDWAESPTSERYGLIPTGLFHGVDFLRSKGYALPWMGLSVEQQIKYGWVKLKQDVPNT